MINEKAKLSERVFKRDIEMVPVRNGYGEGLVEAGEKNESVVVLAADLGESTRSNYFKEKFPERFVEVGVAEQALVTVASGMAAYGRIPFISSYAVFSPGRNWEQIRTTVALNDLPVKIAGAHAGVSVGPDGATHQALEDIALMRVLPNMVVLEPSDAIEARKAVVAAAENGKPTYIRFARAESAVFTTEDSPFMVGRAEVLWQGRDPKIGIVASGPLVYEALKASRELAGSSIDCVVVNNHTIKPMDEHRIIQVAKMTGAIVTVEEHQVAGGMGSAVVEVLAKNYPVPVEMIGMQDTFGESGRPRELFGKYKMTKDDIVKASKRAIRRRVW